jgi:serine/threonine-protein kinase RsbW
MFDFTIKSKTENIALACSKVRDAAAMAGMSEQATMELELAVSEAVTNSIEHAYDWDEEQDILLKIDASNSQLVVNILDQGIPLPGSLFDDFDGNFMEPQDEFDLLAENGRGLNIIRALVDDIRIEHTNGWNSLKLLKNL